MIPRPYFGHVKRVEVQFVGFIRIHDLDFCSPGNRLASFDSLPEVSFRIVGILARHTNCFMPGELLLAVIGDKMILDVDELSVLVDPVEYSAYTKRSDPSQKHVPFKSMAAVSVLITPTLGSTVITEQHQPSVVATRDQSKAHHKFSQKHIPLRNIGQKVKHAVIVQQEVGWITLL